LKLTSIELISACPDPVIIVDNQGVISVFNPAAEKLLGFNAAGLINSLKIADLYERQDEGENVKGLLAADTHGGIGQIQRYETRIMGQSGQVFPVCLSAAVLKGDNNAVNVIYYFQDLSHSEKLEAELRELSRTDLLTGMLNSRQLYISLQEEILRSTRYKHPFALLCFSLNGLKESNDQFGHLVGDDVLKLLALVTRDTLRENDTSYRYTGNEFLVICPETDYTGAKHVAERLQNTFSELLPQALDASFSELNTPLSMSQGITVFYGGNTVDKNELIHQAIQTMDKAKLDSENRIELFQANMQADQ
jgi:diguanylate cyclase (GGDEF)-like protein/PAS domain S-box-containing protein